MADDFFVELGETITKTAKDISTKADSFFESQKIRTKIMTEQRMIDKSLEDIGNIIYKKYVDGEAIDEDVMELCEDITQRKITIAKYRESVAKMKGQKVCAACGASVPMDAAFCMQCGAPCESEEEAEDQEQTTEPVEPAAEETKEEAKTPEEETVVEDNQEEPKE